MRVATGRHRLLEREDELAAIATALEQAAAGSGRVLAITGVAGVGKTALLRRAGECAEDAGFTVLAASGTPLEREIAFGVARQLFEPPLMALGDAAAHSLASGVILQPPARAGPDSAHAALLGLHELVVELSASRGPLLLAIDDAHWADAPSLRWLAYLARRVGALHVAIMLAHRSGEPGADRTLLDRAAGEPQAQVLRPEPLSDTAVGQWLGRYFAREPAGDLVRSCVATTGGNPFLLEEVAESLRSAGVGPDAAAAAVVATVAPAGIARSLRTRIELLGAGAQELLEAASVLSADARLARLAAVTGDSLEHVGKLADGLTDAAILAPGDPIGFRHPVLGATVYDGIPAHQRARLHADAAQRLLDEGAGPERAAAHLLRVPSGGRAWAVPALRSAAAAAMARGAPDAAIPLLRRALAEAPQDRPQLLLELIEAEVLANDPASVTHAREVIGLDVPASERARAATMAAHCATMAHRFADADEMIARADDAARQVSPALRRAVTVEALGISLWRIGTSGHSARLRGLDPDALDEHDPLESMLLACILMDAICSGAPREMADRLAPRLLRASRSSSEIDDRVRMVATRSLTALGRFDEGVAELTRMIGDARSRGAVSVVASGLSMRAEVELHAGRLYEAETDARDGLEAAQAHGLDLLVVPALGMLVRVLIERADPEPALAVVRETGLDGDLASFYTTHILLEARGAARAAAGDIARGIADLRESGRRAIAWGESNPSLLPWRSRLALLLNVRGEQAEASVIAADEERRAREFGAPHAVSAALRCKALLAAGDERVTGLRAAHEAADGAPLASARAIVDLGSALRATGHRNDAREVLARGLDAADRCGARRLADRAREELHALGARPRRERITGRDALTASELRIARLAADGRTNREIAAALFVTVKTVEMHLGHAYSKLSIKGRAALAAALNDEGRPQGRPSKVLL